MMKKISIVIDEDEFEKFKQILSNDPSFVATFKDFEEARIAAENKTRRGRMAIMRCMIHPDEFVSYCSSTGCDPCAAALRNFARQKAGSRDWSQRI